MNLTEFVEKQKAQYWGGVLISERQAKALMDEGAELEEIEEFLSINSEYIGAHGVTKGDIENYISIKYAYENKTLRDSLKKVCRPGDILEVWSNNGRVFYENAHIEKATYYNSGLVYCESPYVPFYQGFESFSTSGGAWHELDPAKCEYVGQREKLIKVWGHCGACASGAFNIKVNANAYKIITDRKYVPLYVGTYKNCEYGYKYFIDTYDKKSTCARGHKECFHTLKGLKDYLKNRKLRIGKRLYWPNQHEIIGDFEHVCHMSLKVYENIRGGAAEFPILSNGNYTNAFYKNGEVHYCNPNVKGRAKLPYINY